MPRKAAVAKAKNPAREANRKARHLRVDEIQERWDERNLRQWFLELHRKKKRSYPDLIDDILHYTRGRPPAFAIAIIGDWLSIEDDKFDPLQRAVTLSSRLLHIIRLKEMPYDEYLRSDHWKYLAEDRKAAFSYSCALDSKHPADDAHHRTYVRRGREYDTDVIPLCRECHTLHHKRGA